MYIYVYVYIYIYIYTHTYNRRHREQLLRLPFAQRAAIALPIMARQAPGSLKSCPSNGRSGPKAEWPFSDQGRRAQDVSKLPPHDYRQANPLRLLVTFSRSRSL